MDKRSAANDFFSTLLQSTGGINEKIFSIFECFSNIFYQIVYLFQFPLIAGRDHTRDRKRLDHLQTESNPPNVKEMLDDQGTWAELTP